MKKLQCSLLASVITLCLSNFAYAGQGLSFRAKLSGGAEVPTPVNTDTKGRASFRVDRDFESIDFKLKIKKAEGILAVAGAHIHCAPEGQNGPVVAFLAGAIPGGINGTLKISATLSDDNIIDVGCGSDVEELAEAMSMGMTYVNVHSTNNPGGEVRGQILGKSRKVDDQ